MDFFSPPNGKGPPYVKAENKMWVDKCGEGKRHLKEKEGPACSQGSWSQVNVIVAFW
jgi:hypothetical protein